MMAVNSSCIKYEDKDSEFILDFSEMSSKQLYEVLYMVINILEKRES